MLEHDPEGVPAIVQSVKAVLDGIFPHGTADRRSV
jgi:hypothetical protein